MCLCACYAVRDVQPSGACFHSGPSGSHEDCAVRLCASTRCAQSVPAAGTELKIACRATYIYGAREQSAADMGLRYRTVGSGHGSPVPNSRQRTRVSGTRTVGSGHGSSVPNSRQRTWVSGTEQSAADTGLRYRTVGSGQAGPRYPNSDGTTVSGINTNMDRVYDAT